jgi:hypothetical protein
MLSIRSMFALSNPASINTWRSGDAQAVSRIPLRSARERVSPEYLVLDISSPDQGFLQLTTYVVLKGL